MWYISLGVCSGLGHPTASSCCSGAASSVPAGVLRGPQPMAESSLPSPCSNSGISPWPQADLALLIAREEAAEKLTADAEGPKPAAGEVRLPLVEGVSGAGGVLLTSAEVGGSRAVTACPYHMDSLCPNRRTASFISPPSASSCCPWRGRGWIHQMCTCQGAGWGWGCWSVGLDRCPGAEKSVCHVVLKPGAVGTEACTASNELRDVLLCPGCVREHCPH